MSCMKAALIGGCMVRNPSRLRTRAVLPEAGTSAGGVGGLPGSVGGGWAANQSFFDASILSYKEKKANINSTSKSDKLRDNKPLYDC